VVWLVVPILLSRAVAGLSALQSKSRTGTSSEYFQMIGSCHCGAIRFEVSDLPFAADFGHCRDCQRITGAPVAAWMDFKVEHVRWLKEKPAEYASSTTIRRGFCSACGSTLSYRSVEHPDYLSLSIASLDDPDLVRPTYHIYTDSQVAWLPIHDGCERYPKGRVT